jgi:hypothetical protein
MSPIYRALYRCLVEILVWTESCMVELYHAVYHSLKVNTQSSLVYVELPALYSRDMPLECLQTNYLL